MSVVRFLPLAIREKIQARPDLRKVLINTIWLLGDKIIRMGMGLLVGVWIARYLGPEQFGLLNYALAFVALFGALSPLGLQGILVRNIVREPNDAQCLISTAIYMQLIGGLCAFLACVAAVYILRSDDRLTVVVVSIVGAGLIFKATDPIRYWFEAKVLSRHVVLMENSVFLIMVAIRVALVISKAPLLAFVWMFVLEAAMVSAGLIAIYKDKVFAAKGLSASIDRAMSLLRESWPLILSGFAIMLYMRIDQVMIGGMLDSHSVGLYSAAIRISEIWYFIPLAIVSSVSPSLIEARKTSAPLYQARLERIYCLLFLLSLTAALCITLFSDRLVLLLYGPLYAEAAKVLSIHVWAGIFVAMGVANSQWLIFEGLLKYATVNTIIGALVNVALNYFLIPVWGIQGAAIATFIAQASSAYIMLGVRKETRSSFHLLTNVFMFRSMRCLLRA